MDPAGLELLEVIASASSGTLGAAVFFGSRSAGVVTTSSSAYDLMLVCDDTAQFYRAAHDAGILKRSPRLLAVLDPFLTPTQVRLVHDPSVAKASVISTAALDRATGSKRKDQFLAGRLFQDVHLVWARSPECGDQVEAAVRSARHLTLDWAAPDLPGSFDTRSYVQQLFRTSFRFEVRPETSGRADALFLAQADRLVPIFQGVLEGLASAGKLGQNTDGSFSPTAKVAAGRRIGRRVFMEWSRVRATLRWPKHAISFDGWLDYIIKKAERHSGETIELTPLERRLPFIFLWPRVFRFLSRQRGKGTGTV